jgi:hypothetical protein
MRVSALAVATLAMAVLLAWQFVLSPWLRSLDSGRELPAGDEDIKAAAAAAAGSASDARSGHVPKVNSSAHSIGPTPSAMAGGLQSLPGRTFIFQRAAQYGYGNFVAAALESAQPRASFEAARLLSRCRTVDHSLESTRKYINSKTGPGNDNRNMLAAVKIDEEIQRHCQAITAVQHEQYLSLMEIAAKGGVLGAASEYYHEFVTARRGDPELVPWFRDVLIRDAGQGDIAAIKALGCDKIGAGLPPVQRQTYLAALVSAASGGRAVEYASMLAEYCGPIQEATTAADPVALQQLLSGIEKVGLDYLSN